MLPEAVAYAGIAGLAPGRALVAGVAGGVAYAVVGRSRFAVLSPTSSSAAILAAAIAGLGAGVLAEPARAALAATIVLLVGAIFLILALLHLGNFSGFISRPVLRGFSFGLAATIIIKQLPLVLGVPSAGGAIWNVVAGLAWSFPQWNWPSLLLGGAALAALLGFRRVPQWPGALLVILAGIAVGAFARPENWGVALAGSVSLAMPTWQLPPLAMWPRLAQLAIPIALILFAESWGTMRGLALKHGDPLDANRELGAIGVANVAAALVQGMPVGAGFSAGSANEAAGAQSRVAALLAALAILALALFAARWIARIPEPVLAAVVIAALTHALSPKPIIHLFQIRRDQWVAVGAALGVLVLGVLNGMLAAIALSIVLLLYDFSRPQISELGRVGDSSDFVDLARHDDASRVAGIGIYRPDAPLFFANAETALRAIAARIRSRSRPSAASAGVTARPPAAKARFSATVSPALIASKCPKYATRPACTGKSANASAPSHSRSPASGRFSPASSRSKVDLPDPFGPSSSSASPSATAKDRSRSTSRSPRNAAIARASTLFRVCNPFSPPPVDQGGMLWSKPLTVFRSHPRLIVHASAICPGSTSEAAFMKSTGQDTLKTRKTLQVGGRAYEYFSLPAAAAQIGDVSRLPMSLKVLLENVLRFEDGKGTKVEDAKAIAAWLEKGSSTREVPFRPSRILMQDFTGVPAVVDLAAMRDGIIKLGGSAGQGEPADPR